MPQLSHNEWWCFLDRDGVLVKDKRHAYKIGDLEILPRVIEGLTLLKNYGFKFVVVTNQAGIAKGHYTHEDAHAFNDELRARLAAEGIVIEATYMCPHHPNHTGECSCRKPNTGMLEKAASDFSITPVRAILIGDKDSDIEAGKRFGCVTFRVVNGQYPETVTADYRIQDLAEAATVVAQKLAN